ncbi:MAG: hypothetical protein ACXWYM_00295 [Candidatus Binatia bacterium]
MIIEAAYIITTALMRFYIGSTHWNKLEFFYSNGKAARWAAYILSAGVFTWFAAPYSDLPEWGIFLLNLAGLIAYFQPAHGAVLIGYGTEPNRPAYSWADWFAVQLTGIPSTGPRTGTSRQKNADAVWGAARYGVFGLVNTVALSIIMSSFIPITLCWMSFLVGGIYRLTFHIHPEKGEWWGHLAAGAFFAVETLSAVFLTLLLGGGRYGIP